MNHGLCSRHSIRAGHVAYLSSAWIQSDVSLCLLQTDIACTYLHCTDKYNIHHHPYLKLNRRGLTDQSIVIHTHQSCQINNVNKINDSPVNHYIKKKKKEREDRITATVQPINLRIMTNTPFLLPFCLMDGRHCMAGYNISVQHK